MVDPQAAIAAAREFFRDNPNEVGRALRSAFGLRLGIPLAAFRWIADQAVAAGKAEDVRIEAVEPGLRVAATIDLMKTPVRASAAVYVERLHFTGKELRIEIRLEEVELSLAGESSSPVAALIKSGALDLSKPGTLAGNLPLPPFIVEARDNRFVLDLMRHPKIGRSELLKNAAGLMTSVVTVHGVDTDDDHLDLAFRALPEGVFHAAGAVRRHILAPSLRRARLLLPGSRVRGS